MNLVDAKNRFVQLKGRFNIKSFKKTFITKDFNGSERKIVTQMPGTVERSFTQEQEYHLFRHYNYLKYKTQKIFNTPSDQITVQLVKELEKNVSTMRSIKEVIAKFNKGLVIKLASERRYAYLESAVSDAYYGLMLAMDAFDYRRGIKFSSYVFYVIKDAIKVGKKFETHFEDKFVGGDPTTILEFEVDKNVRDNSVCNERNRILYSKLDKIHARGRQILEYCFGLRGHQKMNYRETAELFNISVERIRQIVESSIDDLKSLGLKEYD